MSNCALFQLSMYCIKQLCNVWRMCSKVHVHGSTNLFPVASEILRSSWLGWCSNTHMLVLVNTILLWEGVFVCILYVLVWVFNWLSWDGSEPSALGQWVTQHSHYSCTCSVQSENIKTVKLFCDVSCAPHQNLKIPFLVFSCKSQKQVNINLYKVIIFNIW